MTNGCDSTGCINPATRVHVIGLAHRYFCDEHACDGCEAI